MTEGAYLLQRLNLDGTNTEGQLLVKILDRWFSQQFGRITDITNLNFTDLDDHYNLTYIGDI